MEWFNKKTCEVATGIEYRMKVADQLSKLINFSHSS